MNNSRIVELLDNAELALGENLRQPGLDPVAKDHLVRALRHLCEARIATVDIGKARSVSDLVQDLDYIQALARRFTQRRLHRPGSPGIGV